MASQRADVAAAGGRRGALASAIVLAVGIASAASAQNTTNMAQTKHNLSSSGPGTYRALGESRICVFCHTPHNGAALSPLWNKDLEPQTYQVYVSPTLKVAQKLGSLPQPSGSTKLCLSCHDGTIALGAVLNPVGGIAMGGAGTLPPGSLSNFGLDLRGHHPVSFRYSDSLPNPELVPAPPGDLTFGASDEVHCTTCHDPHDDRNGQFLSKDNRFSALCTSCHQIAGWSVSAHATSTMSVVGILPRPPKTWPTWTQLDEWGCESCHTPHFAPTAEQLLIFTAAAPAFTCTSSGCHGSTPGAPHAGIPMASVKSGTRVRMAQADIAGQVQKPSAHHEQPGALSATAGTTMSAGRSGVRAVACADCHNPHEVSTLPAELPNVSGMLQGVRGMDRNGVAVRPATYEYEVCFKCHADFSADVPYIFRAVSQTNLRLAFDTMNPSYHPVLDMGRNLNVPSIPSSLSPGMRSSQIIGCTSCHADDQGGSRGPHGSSYPPILKERYETADGTPESYDVYALCYRCHERSNILSDVSFQKKTVGRTTPSGGGHSGHLAAGTTCATCHDPHGVKVPPTVAPGVTGDHTSLINFSAQVVQPVPGTLFPVFRQAGNYSGSCTLVCHGVTHNARSYP